MRSLNFKELEIFNKLGQTITSNFVETGTYKGLTILPMSQHFKKLYTIEINEKAYIFCKDKAKKKYK